MMQPHSLDDEYQGVLGMLREGKPERAYAIANDANHRYLNGRAWALFRDVAYISMTSSSEASRNADPAEQMSLIELLLAEGMTSESFGKLLYRHRYDLYRLGFDRVVGQFLDRAYQENHSDYYRLFDASPPDAGRATCPSIMLVTMYKSGTDYLSTRISRALNIPIVRIMTGDWPTEIIPSWLRHFSTYGGLCVHHLQPLPRNLDQLICSGVKRIQVHLRDPRQAFLSAFHFEEKLLREQADVGRALGPDFPKDYFSRTLAERIELRCFSPFGNYFGDWASNWIRVSERYRGKIEILFSTYESMLDNIEGYLNRFATFFRLGDAAIARLYEAEGSSFHFRVGRADEWREVLSGEQADFLISSVPFGVRREFGWE